MDYGLVPLEWFLRNWTMVWFLWNGSFGIVPSEGSFGIVKAHCSTHLFVPASMMLETAHQIPKQGFQQCHPF